jgi:hypothetical protein
VTMAPVLENFFPRGSNLVCFPFPDTSTLG